MPFNLIGCKGETDPPLPVTNGKCANMAWAFQGDGKVISGMPNKCLGIDTDDRGVKALDSHVRALATVPFIAFACQQCRQLESREQSECAR